MTTKNVATQVNFNSREKKIVEMVVDEVELDMDAARRLFTLVSIISIKI